jgi:hypothetical protein
MIVDFIISFKINSRKFYYAINVQIKIIPQIFLEHVLFIRFPEIMRTYLLHNVS